MGVRTAMTFSVDVTVRGYELDTQGHLNQAVHALAGNPDLLTG